MEHLQSKQASEHGANVLSACIEQMTYTDCSRITPEEVLREEGILPDTFSSSDSTWTRDPPFPLKLHRILSDLELWSVIAWLPHGRAWRIVDSKKLERKVLPHHFKHSQIKSFMRQVTGWGFRRVSTGEDEGAYYHECFLRGLPHVCLKMRRVTGNRSKFGIKMMVATPDFCELTQKHPLPDVDGTWPAGAEPADQVSTFPRDQLEKQELETQPQQGNPIGCVLGGNISLPQHLLGSLQPSMGWLPYNTLVQSPPNVSLGLASLVQSLSSIQGLQGSGALTDSLSGSMHRQAGSGLSQEQLLLQRNNLSHLVSQQPTTLRSIPPMQSMTQMSTTWQIPQGRQPIMQSMELQNAVPQVRTAAANENSEATSESLMNPAKEKLEEKRKSVRQDRAASAGESKKPSDEHQASTSSLRRTFVSRPELGKIDSQSSSSAGLQESGSESSTDSPARDSEETGTSFKPNECKREKEAGATLFLLSRCAKPRRGSDSMHSSSSVSMSEMGSDSRPQPSESSGRESSSSKQGNAPHHGVLHRHHSSRPKTIDFTRQSTSLSELGSDGSDGAPERSTTLLKSSPAKQPNIERASDQSSDAADVSEASSESIRNLWDLISSAEESNSKNASSLVKASRGLVGALIGYNHNNNSLSDYSTESDATFAASSTERTKRKSELLEAKTQHNPTPAAPSSLDVAAKAMTLGILFGMKRSGSAPEGTTTTSSSGSTSQAGEPRSSSRLDEVENEMRAFLSNKSLRLSIAPALSGQEIQVQGWGNDETVSDELRPSSVSGSSDDEDAKKRKINHEDVVRTADKLGKSGERQKQSTSASESPAELKSGHKRKATHNGPMPCAKRRPTAKGADSKTATSGREKFGTTRSASVSSLTTPLSDFSSISKSNLKTLDKQNDFDVMARSNSNAWSQTSDVSGEDFETGSSQSGSASSNNDFPTTNTSGAYSGSTSNPAGSSTDSSESTAGDDVAACPGRDCGNKVQVETGIGKKNEATEPSKKRARFALA